MLVANSDFKLPYYNPYPDILYIYIYIYIYRGSTCLCFNAAILYIAFEHCQTLQNLGYQILDVCEVSDTSYST